MSDIRAENLAAYLDLKRGNAKKVADALGVTPPTVAQWKNGERSVPEEHLPVICQILGITRDDLVKPMNPFFREWRESKAGQMLDEVLPNISDDGLKKVLALALQLEQSELKQKSGP